MADSRSRKWQLTINNPVEKGFTHDRIKELLVDMKSTLYYCMADEEGQTPHTHLFVYFGNAVRFSTLKNLFPEAHFEMAKGTSQQNRDYIAKEGKWEKDEKHGTKNDGTFEEYGEMPIERQGQRSDLTDLYDMIRSGMSNCQIYESDANYIKYHTLIEQIRQDNRYEQHKEKLRLDLSVTYIYGTTGVGKTRHIMETYPICDVYRITDYKHPFDKYNGEPILVFDEFRSQLLISEMLNYLDIYPLALPSRYTNKQACYTTVYIISNEPLKSQYPNIQKEQFATWKAFLRRIHKLYEYTKDGKRELDIEKHMRGVEPLPSWVEQTYEDDVYQLPF